MTWVIDASADGALGARTGAVSIVPGDDRRRPALAGRLFALLPVVRHANKGE